MSDVTKGANRKAIGLLSGGLDSTLATRIMKKLGFDIIALNFTTPFCTCTTKSHGCKNEAQRLSDELGIPARIEFMGKDYLDLIKNPKFGYGKGMNPCVDCRIMVFRRAKEIMIEEGASFIFTGEVLGQRPMSQKGDRMKLIEKEAGLQGLVVRPLSAKIMAPTIPEKEGIIDREKMLAIQGRSRKEQIKIAKEDFGMTENLCSSGGCLLSDQIFAGRVKDLLDHCGEDQAAPSATVKDARLLRVGRHFRLSDDSKLVVGRDEEENDRLERMAATGDFMFYPTTIHGPLAVLKGKLDSKTVEVASAITARYCSGVNGAPVEIAYRQKGEDTSWKVTTTVAEEEFLTSARI